jgi:hypothetical protein
MMLSQPWRPGPILVAMVILGALLVSALSLAPGGRLGSAKLTLPLGRHGVTVVLGAQSHCPPIVRCPRALEQPPGLAVYLVEGPPDWATLPAQEALPVVSHRRVAYLAMR